MYRILIVPLQQEHSQISWRWRNDPEIWKYTGNKPSLEIERDWIEGVLEDRNSKRFAITVDGLYVGNIQLTNIDQTAAQYHIFIGEKDYWGGGIAFCASQQIIRFAKNVLGLDKLYLEVNPNHERAIKLYERLGFAIVSKQIKMELELNKASKPLVSIFCMVYNHEDFLRKCVDGFIMQKCNFDFEIVVGEDCSTDSSREILFEYSRNYPGKFKLILHDENIGPSANQYQVLSNCIGKYVAMCEGDDFWTDPHKLQRQIEYLESNSEFSFCFHDVNILDNTTGHAGLRIGNRQIDRIVDIESAIIENNFATSSIVFRNIIDWKETPDWFDKTTKGDYAIVIMLAIRGLGKYFSQAMSTYRIHSGGVWSLKDQNRIFSDEKFFYLNLLEYFSSPKLKRKIHLKLAKVTVLYAVWCLRNNQWKRGVFLILKNYKITRDSRLRVQLKVVFKYLLLNFF